MRRQAKRVDALACRTRPPAFPIDVPWKRAGPPPIRVGVLPLLTAPLSCSDASPKGTARLHPFLFLLALLLIAVVLGTVHLGRPLTDEEKKRFGALLKKHDYPGRRLVALRFANKLTRNPERARDLMGRADLRLVRSGWDPAKVTLVSCLCRLVWSEWTNASHESKTAKKAEEAFLRELEATEGLKLVKPTPEDAEDGSWTSHDPEWAVPSHEGQFIAHETAEGLRRKAFWQLEKLRRMFEKAGDEVNLLFLKLALAGVNDAAQMAAQSGRDVAEFYAGAKRRRRAVQRLLASDRGVEWLEEES